MAKLEGVKIIDMQDGEITKIAYGGEEYAYTNTEEERGDIALVVDVWGGHESGEYYNVIKSEHHLYNNDSDEYVHIQGKKGHASCFRRRVRLFRKVSSSTIAERVDELETRVSALEAEETDESPKEYDKPAEKPSIKVGDYAKVIGKTYCNGISEGTIVEVTKEADFEGDYIIDLIDGSEYDFAKPEALEKIELSEADLVFIENGREPGEYKFGDVVRVTDGEGSIVPTGTIGIISRVGGEMYAVDTHDITHANWRGASNMEPIAFVEKRADKIV